MISPFIINDKNLFLDRFPAGQINRSLQAWDAADEYLVTHLTENNLIKEDSNILIMNDAFGALTANFAQQAVYCVNDSYLSQQGIAYNLEQNHIDDKNIHYLSSLDALPKNIELVIYKIPKNKSLLVAQLLMLRRVYNDDVVFIAADRAKEIHSSTLKLFEKYLGSTKTSLAVKKARLVFSQFDSETKHHEQNLPLITVWPLEKTEFTISNHANVYAKDKLDIGARYFMQNLPEVAPDTQLIDLGCGNGVIGLTILAKQPQASVQFFDESHMAMASAKTNIEQNLPSVIDNCQFHLNDCLSGVEGGSVDLILCNPPFHQQTATTDHIAWQMFKDSHRVLKKGGELRIIGNRQLAYHIKLQRIFGNEKLIASNEKFVTLSAIKR